MLWSAPDDPDLKYFREEGHIVAEGVDSKIEMQEIRREKSQVQRKYPLPDQKERASFGEAT